MPQGSKASYSSKQKRMAAHIEESEKKSGRSSKSAARVAWATVNKRDGGAQGKKSSKKSSRSTRTSSRRPGRKSARSHRKSK